jgi:PAS domain S-box-containing protein
MSLKLKVMLILLCVFGLYGVMNFWVQRYVIFPGFLSLERDEAIKNMKRIEKAFKNEIHRLDSICWDWSAWNDSYKFMKSRSAEYIETNLIPGTFAVNNINTIYFINTKEKIIWGKTYGPKYNKIIQLTDFPKDTFPPNHPLISYLSKNIPIIKMGVAGIYMTQNGPMFISSRPITKSNDEGPLRGSLIFGRFLNDEFVKTLVDQTKINFQAFPVHAGSLPTLLKDIPNRITDESRYLVDSSTNDSIYAYTTLPDIIGNAAILIKSQTPKKISEQGYVTVSYAMCLILAIGIGVLIVMSLLLHYSVLGPITDLKNHVMLIRKTGDISASLSSQRRDEIGILAIEFDRMLEQLQRFQTKLEVKVKERTSELAITNENLQQEIEERKQAEEALRESEELLSKFSEATWEAIIIHDRGILLQTNDQYYQMFGYDRAELLGKQAISMTTTPESVKTIMKNINSDEAGPYEVTGIRKDGTEFPMEIRGKMMKYSGKKVRVEAIRDITERKQAENELRKQKNELKIQSQHLHEFNSALKVLLKQRDEDKKEFHESIVANVKELVAPYLAKLSQSKLDERQKSYISLAQANLDDIISPFIANLSSKYLKLTPTEIQVANLIKHGKTTKEIAEVLCLSIETVKFHRKNIRKKIGIKDRKANLRTYLLSIQ